MFKQFINEILLGRELREYEERIRYENRAGIRFLALAGLCISIANIAAQAVVHGTAVPPLYSYILPAGFLILIVIDRFVLPRELRYPAAALYLIESIVLFVSILLGTVLDPTHEAITILLFIITIPFFILDVPLRSILVTGIWSLVFVNITRMVKEPLLAQIDNVHILEFWLASVILTFVMMRARLQFLRQLNEAEFALEHDGSTGLRNRNSFYRHVSRYLNRPVTVFIMEIQDFKMYGDFYGHAIANDMLKECASVLSSEFGSDHTFRYRGNEFLCVLPEINPDRQNAILENCRERLAVFRTNEHTLPLSLNCGYVTAEMASSQDASSVLQLADIYLHVSESEGENRTHGGPFSPETLREAIIQSNLTVHAHSYEIDAQTGLSGVSYFKIHATDLLNTVADMSRRPVIGYLRLEGLGAFNDIYGYSQGDHLITDTARMIADALEERQMCHITAGKFGVMCYREEAEPALRKINELLEVYRPGIELFVSGGFSEYTGDQSVVSLLDEARAAERVFRKKDTHFGFYDEKMDEEIRFSQYIVSHVDDAVGMDYLKLYYQPIIRSKSGHICHEEALVRWDDPYYGFLMPGRFVKVLEENALMYKVNLWVVNKVLEGFRERQSLGVPVVPVSVNLSRTDFEQCDMVSAVTAMVDEAGVSHDMICIEITESAFMKDPELLKREVSRFRENGFRVWIDDFGSEYSTLNLLEEIDFDLIKIDMQFMKHFLKSTKNSIIISSILEMSHRMGITTLMEGVETEEQYKAIREMGCDMIQGYYFNRPNPQDYIIHRALEKTGLVFETFAAENG